MKYLFKRSIHTILACFLIIQYLASGLMTHLIPGVDHSVLSTLLGEDTQMIAMAQSSSSSTLTKEGPTTGEYDSEIEYKVTFTPDKTAFTSWMPNVGFEITDEWSTGLCDLSADVPTAPDPLSDDCGPGDGKLIFSGYTTGTAKLSAGDGDQGILEWALKIPYNGTSDTDKKLYLNVDANNTIKYLFIRGTTPKAGTISLNNPPKIIDLGNEQGNAGGGSHDATSYCFDDSDAIPQSLCKDIIITCDGVSAPNLKNVGGIADDDDQCKVNDIEVGSSVYSIVSITNNGAKGPNTFGTYLCTNSSCSSTSFEFLDNDGGTANSHQHYKIGGGIESDGKKIISSPYSGFIGTDANIVGISETTLTGGQKVIGRVDDTSVYIYPGTGAVGNISGSCKLTGTVTSNSQNVLVGFDIPGNNLQQNTEYVVYDDIACKGSKIGGGQIKTLFNPAYKESGNFCIEFTKDANDNCEGDVTLYFAPKEYEATVTATIDSGTDFTGCSVTNTVKGPSGSPMGLFTTRIDTPECSAGALKVEKTISGGIATGFSVGSGFTFLISVTNGGSKGDKNTSQITIKDILTSTTGPIVRDTKGKITLSGGAECSLIDPQPSFTSNPVTAILKAGITPGKTCTLAIPAMFTGYGCFQNKATISQEGGSDLDAEAWVCSTGMKLELTKTLVSSTSGEAEFKLTIKNTGKGAFPLNGKILIRDAFTSGLINKQVLSNNDGCAFVNPTSQGSSQGSSSSSNSPIDFTAKTTTEMKEGGSCSFNAKFTLSGSSTQTNTGCITKTVPDLGSNDPNSCGSASVSGAAMSGSCVVSGSATSGSISSTCTVTPAGGASVTSVVITALGQSMTGSGSPFTTTFTVSSGSTGSSNVSLGCTFVLSNGFSGSCAGSISNPEVKGKSEESKGGGGGGGGPPKDGQSKGGGGSPKECKGGECKKKEAQASNFGPGATVPYSAGIVNNDPEVAMEGIQFRDELPAGMAMYEWTATIDGQVVKQGNKNGARGRVELTQDLVGVVIPPLKTLNINYITKIDETSNFGKFVSPGANLYECDDNGNKVPSSGNSNPNPNGNSAPQSPQNKCGGGAANAPAGSNNFQPQSVPLPGPGTGSNSGTVSTGGNYDSLRCEPKLYDIMVSKKVITEKIEVGKSIKFEVTIKNEGLRTVTGLVVQDMFSGVVIKPPFIVSGGSGSGSSGSSTASTSTFGIAQGYFSTANTGTFNLMSGGTLSGGQSVTVIIDAILSGTKFENKIQACNYKDILDPDSDACNGFDKGEDDESIVSGGVDVASLGDKLWYDMEGDGLQMTGDKGIGDILTQLVTCGTDVVLYTGRTNSDGSYIFNNLPPGKYAVRFDISGLKSFTISPRNVGTDDSKDSDGEKIDGKYAITECITLSGGQNYLGHDVGMMIDFKNLTGMTFLSLTKTLISSTGNLSVGSEMIFKLTVINEGILGASGVSIKDKFVGLTGLKVGTSENNLRAFPTNTNDLIIRSGITVGGKPGGLGANPCSGADCPPTYGPTGSNQFIIYVAATLISGNFSNYAQLCTYDVTKEGARPPIPNNIPCDNSINQADDDTVSGGVGFGILGDLVWNDLNNNGIQNTGEVGVPGIDLELYTCTNTGSMIKKTKTAADGSYKFDALPAGSYTIKTLLITPNDKYTFVPGMMGSDRTKDSNIKTTSGVTIGWTECIAVAMGSNDTSIDIGLNMNPTDLQVTKTTMTPYVTSGDTITFMIELKNIGGGFVKKYNLKDALPTGMTFDGLNTADKIMLSHWMSGSVTGDSKQLQNICGYPANGRSISSTAISGYVPSSSIASSIGYNQSCVYKVKAKVTSNIVGQMTNTVTIFDVNDESVTTNNVASALVNTQPACDKITLTPSFGDAPLEVTYAVSEAGGYVRLLDSNQQVLSNTPLGLSGKQTFTNPGYYYMEYVSATPTSGSKCLRPVVVRELSECTSITATPSSDTQYNVTCAGNYATSYKIDLYKGVGTNKQLISTINASNGQVTLTDPSPYTIQCTVNGTVSHGLDKIGAYTNPTSNQFQCPYKVRSDGRMCAVDTLIAPMKIASLDMNALAQLPDPIDYCTATEVSTAICVNGPVSAILVKNPLSCTKEIALAQPDLLVTKSADKGSFGEGEAINWTITVKNVGGGIAKGLNITDTIPSVLRIDGYTDIAAGTVSTSSPNNTINWSLPDKVLTPNQEYSFKITTKLLSANIDQLKNTVTVGLINGSESTSSNNTAEYSISKQGNSSIGDLVWNDLNKNGIQDNNEQGIRDIQVQLIGCNNVSPSHTTFTNAQGMYAFNQIGAGSYRILVQLPDKHRVSPRNAGSATSDSNIDPLTNMSECFTISNGQIKTDIDAGLFIDPLLPPQNVNCGNSQIQPEYGEQCDNNTVSSDSICQNCQIIKKSISICGNDLIEQGEDCEINSVPNGKTCYNCKLTENSVCGDGKVSGYEECDTSTAPREGYQCIGCIFIPNGLAVCGNGKQEIGEACDLGSANGSTQLIPSGVHMGKQCTKSCNVINTIGNVVFTYEPPSCTEIDPPSSMEGEYFPFRRDIDDANVVSTCTKDGQILRESMSCQFDLYAGQGGTLSPVKSFATPCYNVSNFDGTLLSTFNALASNKYGKYQIMLDPSLINGVYGEYKLRLKKIDYKVCSGSSVINGGVAPYNTFNDSYDETICEYNFTVTRPYLMQIGSLISSNATDSLFNFYGFSSNEGSNNILSKYGVTMEKVQLESYAGSTNLHYLIDTFVSKYSQLSVESVTLGANILKVPGKEIYVYRNGLTIDGASFDTSKPKTIIVEQGDLKIIGSVMGNTLFIVPNGNIIIGTNDCDKTQVINGIFLTKKSIVSDKLYINNNLSSNRCSKGNIEIKGLIVGQGLSTFISSRRSILDDWFLNGNKKQAVLQGASVLITSNDQLFTVGVPGLDEFSKELTTYKK